MTRRTFGDLERLLNAARHHGDASEPAMEAGDLQELLRELWPRIPVDARREFMRSAAVLEYLNEWESPNDWKPPAR